MTRARIPSAFRLAVTSLCLALLVSCASGHRPPYAGPMPALRDLPAFTAELRRLAASDSRFVLDEIGAVSYPGFDAPLWRLAFRCGAPYAGRVLINAGIHGNEPAGPACVLSLARDLAADPQRHAGWDFEFIPLVNPWGWVHDTRYNQEGIDINRDFACFRSQEARIVRDSVAGRSFDLMLDLHEDPSAEGFYVYQYGRPDRSSSERVVAAIRQAGYPIEEHVSMVILRTEEGIIDAPMLGLYYMQAIGQLSIANYYRLNASRRVFTVETPTRLPEADRLGMQRTAVDMFITDTSPPPAR
jgi:hypothetical protein